MRNRIFPVLLMASSVVVGFLLLEIAARLIDGVPVFLIENFVAEGRDAVHLGDIATYDPLTGVAQRPNVQKGDEFTSGEYGVRMPSSEIRPLPQGGVLVVGDSFAVGSEVPNHAAWPAQLASMIDRPVVNAAVGGFATDQTILRAEDLIPRLHPEVLLIEIVGQFSLVTSYSIYGGAPKPYFTVENGRLALHNVPVPRQAASPREIGWARSILGYSYLAQFTMIRLNLLQWWSAGEKGYYKQEYPNEEGAKVSCLLMQRLAALRDRSGLRVGVIVQYNGPEGIDNSLPWYGQSLEKCAREAGLDTIGTFEALHAYLEKNGIDAYRHLWVMHDNGRVYGHMSEEGNRLVASLIAEHFFKTSQVSTK